MLLFLYVSFFILRLISSNERDQTNVPSTYMSLENIDELFPLTHDVLPTLLLDITGLLSRVKFVVEEPYWNFLNSTNVSSMEIMNNPKY